MTGGVSLGVWASGYGKTVVTIEIPGYNAPRGVWQSFLGAVWRFLRIPAGTGGSSSGTQPQSSAAERAGTSPSAPVIQRRAAEPIIQREQRPVSSADLPRRGSAVVDRFMRDVFDAQVRIWTTRGATYFEGLPAADLVTLSASDSLPGRTIELERGVTRDHLLPMLGDARRALSAAQSSGVSTARHVTSIRVRSGYRGAREQLRIWQREYGRYYRDTRSHRATLPGGEYGPAAVQYLAEYINERVFSPGYSPHQRGQTVDLTYQENGVWAEADSSPAGIAGWRASWLFGWLRANAARYGFVQNPQLNEPWHWEYRPLRALFIRFILWLRQILRRFFLGEENEETE
jgi:hypothetical protein